MRPPALAFGLSLCLGFAGNASAAEERAPSKPRETADQSLLTEDESWHRNLHDALRLPEWIDLGVEQRARYEYLRNPWRPGEPTSDGQLPLRTRLRLGIDAFSPVRFLLELEDARTNFDDPGDFTGNETDELDILQLLVTAGTPDLLGLGLPADAHLGRMTMDVGSRRLVARNRFRNTTNSFDGIHLQLGPRPAWRVRAFAVKPVEREEHTMDDSAWQQYFWGAALESKQLEWLNGELYYFGLDDRASATERRYTTLGARGLRVARKGQIDYEVELAGQFGERGSDDQSAFYGHAELGYSFDCPWSPRLIAQFDYASGTADPDGDDSNAFDPLFGARRWDLNPTGIFGPFRRTNIVSPGVRLQVAPLPTVRAFVKVRYWELEEAKDAFAGNGLSDPTGEAGDHLGTDVELSVSWSPRPWWALEVGYDHWWKGQYLRRVPNVSSTKDSDYFFVSNQFRF